MQIFSSLSLLDHSTNHNQLITIVGVMYRKRRPEDVAHSASNTTLSSTPAQSVSPLLPSQRPTYGSVNSVEDTVDSSRVDPGVSSVSGVGGSANATTAAAVETYKPVSED